MYTLKLNIERSLEMHNSNIIGFPVKLKVEWKGTSVDEKEFSPYVLNDEITFWFAPFSIPYPSLVIPWFISFATSCCAVKNSHSQMPVHRLLGRLHYCYLISALFSSHFVHTTRLAHPPLFSKYGVVSRLGNSPTPSDILEVGRYVVLSFPRKLSDTRNFPSPRILTPSSALVSHLPLIELPYCNRSIFWSTRYSTKLILTELTSKSSCRVGW